MEVVKDVCEEKVFKDLYTENSEHLRNYIYYKCGDQAVAEDIAQESFIKMWTKCKEVIFEKAKSFLFTVGHRLMLDKIKSQKVRLNFAKHQVPRVNSEDPYFVLRTAEFQEKLELVISNLPAKQREIFLLNRIDKLSFKKIAEMLEISQTAVEKRMSKALFTLRSQIEELKKIKI